MGFAQWEASDGFVEAEEGLIGVEVLAGAGGQKLNHYFFCPSAVKMDIFCEGARGRGRNILRPYRVLVRVPVKPSASI